MRHTRTIIDLSAIKSNLATLKKLLKPTTGIIAVVKANAYGHGAIAVAQTALEAGCNHLAVALPAEGLELRQAGITAPILILGLIAPEEADLCVENQLVPTICHLDHLLPLSQAAEKNNKNISVILKTDTGMNRIGANHQDTIKIAQAISTDKNISLLGLFTHFAAAGNQDTSYAQQQLKNFNAVIKELASLGIKPPLISAAASSASISLPESQFDLVREGIAMYGLYPSEHLKQKITLKPALSLVTRISHIKKLPANSFIGYEMTYKTKTESYIATLPLGYGDGYSRLLSNKASVLIGGQFYQQIGNICMDQMMVDLGTNHQIKIGDEVVLVGQQGSNSISLEDLAKLTGTINYELACNLALRIPAIYTT